MFPFQDLREVSRCHYLSYRYTCIYILAEVPGVAQEKLNPILTHARKISIGLENMWKS